MDQPNQWTVTVPSMPDSTYNHGAEEDAQLGDFMARPVLIYSYDWAVGAGPDFVINPWTLFYSNPRVINRINNYNLLRSTLNVKIQVSGTIFHYGRMLVSYKPLPQEDTIDNLRYGNALDIVQRSQRPHIFIDPSTSQGGELKLPFFYYNNWLSIPLGDWSKMGDLTFTAMQALQHANGGTTSVTIKVFAYATDIKLSVPTTSSAFGLTAQSADEYGKGIISKTATAVAKAMHELVDIPYIAPYARATTMLMSSTATIASTLGFSRPAVLSDPAPIRQLYYGNLANADAPDLVYKNTVDSKNELTVDPRTVGLDGKDQMSISHITSIESWFTAFSWSPTITPETLLYNFRVSPTTFRSSATEYHMTSVCHASRPFKYWTGTLTYRFMIVASAFHKGRIKVVYEPFLNPLSTAEYNIAYTRIVDIAEERDFCIDVGWGQPQTFLEISPMNTTTPYQSTRYTTNSPSSNGILSVYVVNELVSPAVTSDPIYINVFIAGQKDLSFAVPHVSELSVLTYLNELSTPPTIYTPQSKELPSDTDMKPDCALTTMALSDTLHDDKSRVVFMGEEILSFRTLLRRYNLLKTVPLALSTITTDSTVKFYDSIYPNAPGYSAEGILQVTGSSANLVHNTLFAYLAPAYVGYRGSIRYKHKSWTKAANVDDFAYIETTTRTNSDCYTIIYDNKYPANSLTLEYGRYGSMGLIMYSSALPGRIITGRNPGPALESEFAFYDNYRFRSTRDPLRKRTGTISSWDKSYEYVCQLRASSVYNPLSIYIATGEDFSFFMYLGSPIVYYWDPTNI